MSFLNQSITADALWGWGLAACVLHVTLFALVGAAAYKLMSRRGPAAAAWAAAVVLLGVAIVTGLSLAPWPTAWSVSLPADWQASLVPHVANAQGAAATPPILLPPTANPPGTLPGERPDILGDPREPTAAETVSPVPHEPAWQLSTWPWSATIAVVGVIGIVWMTCRLAAGLWAIRRCRRRAQPIDDSALEGLAWDLAGQLGCSTPFELAVSPDVGSPATVGWRRPMILLPCDWRTWTPDERRAVLAHEIAHIYRRDYATWLAALVVRAAHFYHPLVHWLVNRLRLQQELAADALAIRVAGGRNAYLMTLARMTLDYDRRLAGPARAFLPSPGTLFRRIEMLSNDKVDTAAGTTFSRRARRLTVALLTFCALLIVALRGPANQEAQAEPPQLAANLSTFNQLPAYPLAELSSEVNFAIACRPAELFDEPEQFQAWLKLTPLRWVATVKPEEVESIVLAKSRESSITANLMVLLMNFDQGVITLKQAPDWTKLLEAGGAKPTAIEHKGKTVYRFADAPLTGAYVVRPKQLLIAPGRQIETVVVEGKIEPVSAWKEALQDVAASSLVTVVPGATFMQGELSQKARDPADAVVQSLAQGLKMAVMTSKAKGPKGLEYDLEYRDAAAAKTALETSGPQIRQLQAMVDSVMAQLEEYEKNPDQLVPGSPQAALQGSQPLIVGLKQMLAGYTAKQDGNRLRITTDADVTQLAQLADGVTAAQAVANRQRSMNQLRQVMLALHNYANDNGPRGEVGVDHAFPPAATHSADGKPLLSWRVYMLPYLEQNELFKQFHLDEAWDSPHNKTLLDKMPTFYASTSLDAPKSTNTAVVAIVGPHAVLDQSKPRSFREIIDGTSNTIAIVEKQTEIPWTKPEDLAFDPTKDPPKIEGIHGGGSHGGYIAGFADGHVRFISLDADPALIKKLMTIDGKEPVQLP